MAKRKNDSEELDNRPDENDQDASDEVAEKSPQPIREKRSNTQESDPHRKSKFDALMATVNEKYKGKYMAFASDTSAFKMERIPTGILAVDAITYGGLPKGRIVIFWGEWSSAKTFTSFKAVSRAQRTCRQCLSFMARKGEAHEVIDRETGEIIFTGVEADEFLSKVKTMEDLENKKNLSESEDALTEEEGRQLHGLKIWHGKSGMRDREFRVDSARNIICTKCGCTEGLTPVWTAIEDFEPDFARMCGVDLSNLIIVRSEYAEQAIDISAEILRSGKCDLMVIDSIAMLTPAKEIEESVTGDAVVSIRYSGTIQTLPIASLCEKWERGELGSGAEVRGYSQDSASFGWYPLNRVWRLPEGKRIFKVRTKYGREIRVTEDHSVFRVLPVNRRCVNRAKHRYRYSAAVECVNGKDLRVGDLMLLEDSFECGNAKTVRLSDELREAACPVYAASIAKESYEQCKRGRDPKGNWSHGSNGEFLPLSVAHDEDISFSGSEILYGRGSSHTISNDLPSGVVGWLIGFVAGDGYVFRQDTGSSGIRLYVGDGNNARRILRKISALKRFGNVGIKAYRRASRMTDVQIHCSPLVQVFERWFGGQEARSKRLPSIVFGLDEAGRRAVIEGLIDSDGHRAVTGNRHRLTVSTSSKLLAWDVIELLKSVGVIAALRKREAAYGGSVEGRTIRGGESWVVDFSGWSLYENAGARKGSGRSQIDMAAGIPVRIQSIEEVRTEEVFDLSVAGAETFVANGLLVHNSAEKWQQGLAARLMNKALRRWTSGQTVVDIETEAGTKPTIIMINQVRNKIGIIYGCFSHRTRVLMADGTTRRISNLVKTRNPGPVMSYDPSTGLVEPKNIVNWYQNGKADKFLTVKTTAPNACGYCTFDATPNHRVFRLDSAGCPQEVAADQLVVGDTMLSSQVLRDSSWFNDLSVGSILGDGGLRMTGNVCASLRMTHSAAQDDYLRWKVSMLQEVIGGSTRPHVGGGLAYDSTPDARLADLMRDAYGSHTRKFTSSWRIPDSCGPLALAVWYMDDGTFSGSYEKWGWGKVEVCAKSMSAEQRQQAADWCEKLGAGRPTVNNHGLLWSGDRSKAFFDVVAQYIPSCMEYKLHPKLRGGYKWEPDDLITERTELVNVTVTSIKERTDLGCAMQKYDLEIDGNHTYMVGGPGGVVVHNSPDVMPGGKGQTFANSLVLKFRGGKKTKIDDTGETVNHQIHVKVEKSKVCPPDEQGDFVIWLREHQGNYPGSTSEPKVVFETALKEGIIVRDKTSYTIAGQKHASQKSVIAALTEDELLLDATRMMIIDRMNDRRLRYA